MNLIRRYFGWLQHGNFTGTVERFPVLDEHGQTLVRGVYVVGDLTGVPLLKLAAESGLALVEHLSRDHRFAASAGSDAADAPYDLVIVGGGPAGVSTAIEAMQRGWRVVVIEASRPFTTIHNFPLGKPIFDEPASVTQRARLQTPPGTRETLVTALDTQLAEYEPQMRVGETVESLDGVEGAFIVRTRDEHGAHEYHARRVVLAIGHSGNPRRIGVAGEDLPKVSNRLIDPTHHRGDNILVVGGGDAAVETAVALANAGNNVTMSYRGASLARPSATNLARFDALVRDGRIEALFESQVIAIESDRVALDSREARRYIANDHVYVMVGAQPPEKLLRRFGVALRGEWTPMRWFLLGYGVLFACVVYFGKKSSEWNLGGDETILSSNFWRRFASLPSQIASRLGDSIAFASYTWRDAVFDGGAWLGAVLFALSTLLIGAHVARNARRYFSTPWQTFKYAYFALAAVLFVVAFFGGKYFGYRLGGMNPSFWYTFLYSLTILVFGLRRMHRTPTRYIRRQTWTLIAIQIIPLFLLPEIILPLLWKSGALTHDSWAVANMFPLQSWNNEPSFWRAYGIVLAWPLFIYNVFDGSPTTFWLVVSFVQTFVIIPLIVLKWGKGAYCGWICSCGGLAETLGDEYRGEAPHGPVAKRWENAGQYVLAFVFLLTAARLLSVLFGANLPGFDLITVEGERFYSVVIDIIFAGILGVGVYFFLSGRVWCRFACPLAALMHIYARFTRYRIFAAKEKCISCNVCTSNCHMGIDVMGYANKGIPMDDVECVRCSACIVSCPMDVLSFGELPAADTANRTYLALPIVQRPVSDWTSGRRA